MPRTPPTTGGRRVQAVDFRMPTSGGGGSPSASASASASSRPSTYGRRIEEVFDDQDSFRRPSTSSRPIEEPIGDRDSFRRPSASTSSHNDSRVRDNHDSGRNASDQVSSWDEEEDLVRKLHALRMRRFESGGGNRSSASSFDHRDSRLPDSGRGDSRLPDSGRGDSRRDDSGRGDSGRGDSRRDDSRRDDSRRDDSRRDDSRRDDSRRDDSRRDDSRRDDSRRDDSGRGDSRLPDSRRSSRDSSRDDSRRDDSRRGVIFDNDESSRGRQPPPTRMMSSSSGSRQRTDSVQFAEENRLQVVACSKTPVRTPSQALTLRRSATIERESKREQEASKTLYRCSDFDEFIDSLPKGSFRQMVMGVERKLRSGSDKTSFHHTATTAWAISGRNEVRACVLMKATVGKGLNTLRRDLGDHGMAEANAYYETQKIVDDLEDLFNALIHLWSDSTSRRNHDGDCTNPLCCVQFEARPGDWSSFPWTRLVRDERYLIEFIELLQHT